MLLKQIQEWANGNRGFIALIAVVIAGIKFCGPRIVQATSSFLGFVLALASRSYGRCLSFVEEKLGILGTRPEILLDETASASLSNWSFGSDQWDSDEDGLSVTGSVFGGICKTGSTWENYEFTFEFKIMNKCAAWIVRAGSRDHYVMVQCNKRQVRPHTLTVIEQPNGVPKPTFNVVTEIDHGLSLTEWNRVRTVVRGHSIKVWIEEKLVWSHSELLGHFPMGTVGFRSSPSEHALFRSIRVAKIQV